MSGRPPRRIRSSAHRFQLRRMDYAVVGRHMPQEGDPLRAQRVALLAGCALTVGALVLTTALPAARPGAGAGDAPLVVVKQSGALFARVDQQLRPVANLASARLLLGSPEVPRLVDEAALDELSGGPVLGIPGAPQSLGQVIEPAGARWAVCDDTAAVTTVSVADDAVPANLDPHDAVLVAAAHGDGSVYLLYDGKRAAVDPSDPVTARTLHLGGVPVRKVSSTMLNAIPEVPGIGPPRIGGVGEPSGVAAVPIGTVLRVPRADSSEFYLVLAGGVQRVGALAADLIRFADPHSDGQIVTVAPGFITDRPLLDALPLAAYPEQPPHIVDAGDVLCATWSSGRSGIAAGAGPSRGVTLAGSDGAGPGVDVVRVPPGRSLDVIATMLTTDGGGAGRYLVNDAGVRFAVHDSAAAAALGLGAQPAAVPWAIIGALPAGPELARDAALVARDVPAAAP
ncbi:type VII secretion protein EccB [Mycolicibacterium litorale]|nr:type VII secretion protein EccB [Mycolicibacterium litorale]